MTHTCEFSLLGPIIKYASSSTYHKKTPFLHLYLFMSLCLSLREFKTSFPNTFIYESILMKIYVNANIMNMKLLRIKNIDIGVRLIMKVHLNFDSK